MEKLKNFLKLIDKPLFILICVLVIIEIYSECNQLMTHPRYTIGVITKFYRSGYAVKSIEYSYKVNGKEYLKGEFYHSGEVGKRYWVRFSSKNPRYNELLDTSPVPDSILSVPPEGLEKIPKKSDMY